MYNKTKRNLLTKMKILHFADLHLGMENYGKIDPKTGLNSRFQDFLKNLDRIFEFALKEKVDLVLFCGDAYKNREPDLTWQSSFAQRIKKIAKKGIKVVLIVGNHDKPISQTRANTLDIFSALEVENVFVSREPEILKISLSKRVLQIATLPWINKNQWLDEKEKLLGAEKQNQILIARVCQKIKELEKKIDPRLPAIFAGHLSCEGGVYGSEREVLLGQEIVIPLSIFLESKKFCYFALGHLHHYQVLSNNPPIVYSGSIERINFGEEREEKGFVIASLPNQKLKYQFIPLSTRKFLTIRVSISQKNSDPTGKILNQINKSKIAESIIRVIIQIPQELQGLIRENPIREALAPAHYIAGITKEIIGLDKTKTSYYFESQISLNPLEQLEKYFKVIKVEKGYQKKLLNQARKLVEQLEQ